MKEEEMEHGTKQDWQAILHTIMDTALEAEKKERLKLMAELGVDEKADE